MKLSKYYCFTNEIQYFGHILSIIGMKPLPLNTEAIKVMKLPGNTKQVQAFLGLVGYYHKFIKTFDQVAKLLTTIM